MAYYTKEQIEQVRLMDLLTYLQEYEPTELVHIRGNVYCTREHDSLKISNGKWMWWSRGIGGVSALDYLIKVKGMSFTDAMEILTRGAGAPSLIEKKIVPGKTTENRKLLLPEKSETNDEVIRYLTERMIDKDLVEACIRSGVLYESLPYHNCVFVGMDNDGIPRYACYRSTNNMRLLGDASGSDKRYSFRMNAKGKALHLFESPIDLLSYLTIVKRRTGMWLSEPMLSLGGVYEPSANRTEMKLPIALMDMLENHPEVMDIALHLDNDKAGKTAAWSIEWQLKDKYKVIHEPPPYGKDYNEYLMKERDSYER